MTHSATTKTHCTNLELSTKSTLTDWQSTPTANQTHRPTASHRTNKTHNTFTTNPHPSTPAIPHTHQQIHNKSNKTINRFTKKKHKIKHKSWQRKREVRGSLCQTGRSSSWSPDLPCVRLLGTQLETLSLKILPLKRRTVIYIYIYIEREREGERERERENIAVEEENEERERESKCCCWRERVCDKMRKKK